MSLIPYGSDSFEEALLQHLLQMDEDRLTASRPGPTSAVSSFPPEKDEFLIRVDVQHFRPEEVKVQLAGGFLVVEGKHDERADEHGVISRQFVRKYHVPDDVDESAFRSSLSSDGVLTIRAGRKSNAPNVALLSKESSELGEGQSSEERSEGQPSEIMSDETSVEK